MVVFWPISYNLWRRVFPWAPSIRDEGHCAHAAMVSQTPPHDHRIRASDSSYVRTMGEGPKVVLMVLDAPKMRHILAPSAQMVPKLGRQYV